MVVTNPSRMTIILVEIRPDVYFSVHRALVNGIHKKTFI